MHLKRSFLSLAALVMAVAVHAAPAWAQDSGSTDERALIGILQSDAPAADKAMTCKRLTVYGSKDAVPALAPLLADERLSSWARLALEAIPGPEADRALRDGLQTVKGRQLIGVINSIGVRRDSEAIAALAERLGDQEAAIASAAAVALGHIGGDAAISALRTQLADAPADVRSAVAEGLILCAEGVYDSGQLAAAIEIYDQVRGADLPTQRKLEATRGAILARQTEGIPLLIEQLRSADEKFVQLGLMTARELEGAAVTEAIAAEVAEAAPARAALLLYALADRGDVGATPAVLAAAAKGEQPVRIAAISVLRKLGDASCLPALLKIATENDPELVQAAKDTLAEIPDPQINPAIASRLSQAQGKLLPVLIELIGQRRIAATAPLVKALDHGDAKVRQAALLALGETIGPEDVAVLIQRVSAPTNKEDAEAARKALRAASVRMPDREACAKLLVAALPNSSPAAKLSLLETLAAMGGKESLRAIGQAAGGGDASLQDAGSRLLGEWMTVDAGPVLLELAQKPGNRHNVRALRGFIRLARQFDMPDDQRAEMCSQALKTAQRHDERKLVLDVLERYASLPTLRVAVDATDYASTKEDATRIALTIAQKVGGNSDEVRALLAKIGQEPVKLEIIEASYGAGDNQKDVTDVIEKNAKDLLLIALPSASYNASFGGDPAPGTTKQLRIRYRINGKEAESTFPENAVILLAKPNK